MVVDFPAPFTALSERRAHHTRQRTAAGLVDIGHAEAGRVELVARAHTADDGHARLLRLENQRDLGRHSVDGVDDIVVLRKIKLIRRLRQIEALVYAHIAVRVDLQNAVAHDLDLVFADGFARGDDLPVEVRQADLVVVDEIERTHAAAHKRLADIAAHAADAEHGHARPLQLLHGLRAEQELRSRKLIEHNTLDYI